MKIGLAIKKCSFLPAFFFLAGCTLKPSIIAAHSENLDGRPTIEVLLGRGDASAIKEKQLYFSIVLVNCNDGGNPYPAEAYIQGRRASNFAFSTHEQYVGFNAEVPKAIFDQYRSPCVFLRGGSYFHGKIETVPVPLVPREKTQ